MDERESVLTRQLQGMVRRTIEGAAHKIHKLLGGTVNFKVRWESNDGKIFEWEKGEWSE